jgi:hypothetical protein
MNVMQFRVYTAPDGTPAQTDLLVLPADRMRAERSSTQLLPPSQRGANAVKAHAETWVLLWLYCAAQRLQLTAGAGFDDWANTVLDYDRLDADGNVVKAKTPEDQVEDPAVDPTQTADSTS